MDVVTGMALGKQCFTYSELICLLLISTDRVALKFKKINKCLKCFCRRKMAVT